MRMTAGRSTASAGGVEDVAAAPSSRNDAEKDCSKRVLVADDDAGHVALIKRALQQAHIDCAVDAVGNGVEVIDYLFRNTPVNSRGLDGMPDLILLDLNMPEVNGRQVLQMLGNTRGKDGLTLPPVVVLTASDDDADLHDSYKLGAQSFIRKPVDHSRFALAVQQTTRYWLGLNEPRSGSSPVGRASRLPR
jgi:two-component system response regulator